MYSPARFPIDLQFYDIRILSDTVLRMIFQMRIEQFIIFLVTFVNVAIMALNIMMPRSMHSSFAWMTKQQQTCNIYI